MGSISVSVPIYFVIWVLKAVAEHVGDFTVESLGDFVAETVNQRKSLMCFNILSGSVKGICVLSQFHSTKGWIQVPGHLRVIVECHKGFFDFVV